MKKHLSTIALILALLAGVSLLLYPTVSDYWNARHASRAVADYAQNVQALDRDTYDELLAAAKKNGYRTMRDSCRELVLRGVTTAEEASRTINSTLDE